MATSGLWGVSEGGTGLATITVGRVLIGNGTSAVNISKAAPTGDFVGTTDTQTLSNKTLSGATINGSSTVTGSTVTSSTITSSTISSSTISSLATPLTIANGGTGLSSVSNNKFLTTDGSGNIVTTIDTSSVAVATNGTVDFTRTASSPFSGALNVTANWAKTGKICTISWPTLQTAFGGSPANTFSFDAAISDYWPIDDLAGRLICYQGDTPTEQFGKYYYTAAGVLTITLDSGSWTTGSSNGFHGFSICFPQA